jgi:hypothetical protein
VASARTQREITERGDHSTTTALAAFSAASMTSSKASPGRRAASHQTLKPWASKAAA